MGVLIRLLRMIKLSYVQLLSMIVMLSIGLFVFLKNNPTFVETKNYTTAMPNYKVHIFYDGSFRSKFFDNYDNWNYNKDTNKIDSEYFPSLGAYSSNDPNVVDVHMKQIREAGVGVVVVSWWPETFAETPPMALILKCANKYKLKVTIHVQDYPGRTINNLKQYLEEFFIKYGAHPAFYRTKLSKKRTLPMIYIYKTSAIPIFQWYKLLSYASGNFSVRGTALDALYIGLIKDETDSNMMANSKFDGFYTFYSFRSGDYATTWFNWPYIQDFARDRKLVFIPTVSPGYSCIKTTEAYKKQFSSCASRALGAYYITAWNRAVISRSKFIAINSFNMWPQGSQIEPAQSKKDLFNSTRFPYDEYKPDGPYQYLTLTKLWINEFTNRSLYRIM